MYAIQELQAVVAQTIDSENFIRVPESLYLPIDYAMRQGGKRIRPVLCLMGCDLFGGNVRKAVKPAIGVEMFHNFTLLHDDIMDNSPLRRGMPTVYKKWNANIAILSGDTMFAMAYEYIMQTEPSLLLPVMKVFNQTAIEICEGQQFDMDFETSSEVGIKDYMGMIRLKTGVLLGGALKIGAIIAGASEKDADLLYRFGEKIGIAFQLQDDLLDCWSDVNVFGKVTGTDISDNKKTFLYLKALEIANPEQKKTLLHYFSSKDFDRETKVNAVKSIYETLDMKQHALNEMRSYYNVAMDALNSISVEDGRKQELIKFANKLMDRKY